LAAARVVAHHRAGCIRRLLGVVLAPAPLPQRRGRQRW
jgi:hypothetical protein